MAFDEVSKNKYGLHRTSEECAAMQLIPIKLAEYGVTEERGFLPISDPVKYLSGWYGEWEEVTENIPQLLAAGKLYETVRKVPLLNLEKLKSREYECAHRMLSFLASACVWERWQENIANPSISASIAIPLCEISKLVGRPPILAYASYGLQNWQRIDPTGPIALGNIALIQKFLGGLDEEWFTLVHIEMEAHAGKAVASAIRAQEAALDGCETGVHHYLASLAMAQQKMFEVFCRMPEKCDPYIYYMRVRPWIHGWINQPLLPDGVLYEGVTEFEGKPQKFRGETGAQSSIMPLLDSVLGVVHESSKLSEHLAEMRRYMPPGHRALIAAVEQRPSIVEFVSKRPVLACQYNTCLDWASKFRKKHLEYANVYIHNQASRGKGNPTDVGTGGTPFLASLKKHQVETEQAKLR